MQEIKIFESNEFGKVRTINENGQIWFVGKDVCEIFGDTNYRRSISRIDEDEKKTSNVSTNGGSQNMILLNESGLYSLLFLMQPQKAKGVSQNESAINERIEKLREFKRWITHEVLPSIRKHGGYIKNQENLSDDELMARALEVAQRKIAEKNKLIEEQASKIQQDTPKVLFADSVSASSTSILVGELAKLLNQNGIKTGQKRLFSWLRENGYLMKNTSSFNLPTQKAMELGLFEIKESTVINPDNSVRINKTTKVTGKGQLYFVNKFLGGLPDAI